MAADPAGWNMAYAAEGDYHYGIASLMTGSDAVGQVYFRAAYIAAPFSSG